MGRIPTFVIIIIGVVLVVGLSALMMFVVLKPQQELLATAIEAYDAEKVVADRLDASTGQLAAVTAEWLEKQETLKQLMKTRSIPISFGHPPAAMIALWYEYREDLAPLIQQWVESSGCRIESGASIPAPAMTPPPPPANGFMQIPDGQTITLTVVGDLTSLERLYRSLDQFERVVTVSQLILQGEGADLRAQVPFKFYLLAEVPASMVAAPVQSGPSEGEDADMEDMMNEEGDGADGDSDDDSDDSGDEEGNE